MKSKVLIVIVVLAGLIGCALSARTADNITLARVAKDYIGVASVDEMEISNVQKLPVEGSNLLGQTNYRYFVDTARRKKFICDVVLWGTGSDGRPVRPDEVRCESR